MNKEEILLGEDIIRMENLIKAQVEHHETAMRQLAQQLSEKREAYWHYTGKHFFKADFAHRLERFSDPSDRLTVAELNTEYSSNS